MMNRRASEEQNAAAMLVTPAEIEALLIGARSVVRALRFPAYQREAQVIQSLLSDPSAAMGFRERDFRYNFGQRTLSALRVVFERGESGRMALVFELARRREWTAVGECAILWPEAGPPLTDAQLLASLVDATQERRVECPAGF